jgi:tetratricopeptide (TPR) repeat protein
LPEDERPDCAARVRAFAASSATLRRARAAQAANEWTTALELFADALAVFESHGVQDPGVLGEAAWAHHQASSWCADTQDLHDLRYELEAAGSDDELPSVAVLCLERVALTQAVAWLETALTLPMSRERRAMLLYNYGRIAGTLGDSEGALTHLRASLCLRPNATAREHYAHQLWAAGDATSADDPDAARGLYRQSLVVLPDADRARTLAAIEHARREPFALQPGPDADPTVYPNLRELCLALLAPTLSEPLTPEDDIDIEGCEVPDWEPIERPRQPSWSVGVLALTSPEVYDGYVGASFVVAHVPGGYMSLLSLGEEHGDSRTDNAYVGSVNINVIPDADVVSLFISWEAGQGSANGCDWDTEAAERMALCGWEGRRPRCFAQAPLGPVPFSSETMLGTIQEALGRCEEADWQPTPRAVADYRRRYFVSAEAQELSVSLILDAAADPDAEQGVMCLPLLPSVCALSTRPAVGCP